MTGVGLEPTTNGLTYLIGFRRPPRSQASRRWASGLSHRHHRRAASSLWGRGRRSAGLLPADCPIPELF